MTESEHFLRSIIGATREDILPSAHSLDVVSELLFVKKYSMDEIRVTKHVYPEAAKRLGKKSGAVSRSVERLNVRLWEDGDREMLLRVTGRKELEPQAVRETLIYLAYYLHTGASLRSHYRFPMQR